MTKNLNMNNIGTNIETVTRGLKKGVRLVAVSKFHPATDLQAAYDAGQRIFGESHAQEVTAKAATLPKDIEWHFIGHLQTNKVKYIAPFVSLIHSVDSLKLLKEIDRQGMKNDRAIDCLLQIHIAKEETKFGLSENEVHSILASEEYARMRHIRICGIMCMATNTDDEEQIRQEFRQVKGMFDRIKTRFFADAEHFKELSMGMSDDYHIAMEEGSTLVRVGSKIFGERTYA
jgi:pyridoxal phosphate enzyme (YggS family)